MKKQLLIATCLIITTGLFAQDKKTKVSYYNGNRLSISLFSHNSFYPEFQIESDKLEIQDARYAFLIRNRIPLKEVSLVWGAGFSYSDIDDNYGVLPIEIQKSNLFKENISLSLGLEVCSDFNEKIRIKPLAGISINF